MVEDNPPAEVPKPDISLDEAKSQVDRAMDMLDRDDLDGALAIFAEIDQTLRYIKDAELRIEWARCLNGLGFIDLMDAKKIRSAALKAAGSGDAQTDDLKEFHRGLRHALAYFDQALAVQADETYRRYVLGKKAYCLALLGRNDAARESFSRLFADGDRAVYDGQIADTGRSRTPEDGAVIRLIDDVWTQSISKD